MGCTIIRMHRAHECMGMGCMVYWGAQGLGVHGNGVRDVLGCTGHKGAWKYRAWFIGVHRGWGCMEMGSAIIRVHRTQGYTGMGCVIIGVHGVLEWGFYGVGEHGLLGYVADVGCRGLQCIRVLRKQGAWGWGVIYWDVQGMQVHGDLGCMGTGCKNYWGADASCGVSRGTQRPEGTVYRGTQELGSTGIWGM